MEQYYTDERNVQILIALLKEHGIKRVVASPGSTNVTFVGSLQQDDFFEMYSCVDERSAAYMAVGMVAETGEPVVLSCTGATASRNYFPALTEAYYRQLPLLVVTSSQFESKIGHLIPQVLDRSSQPVDTVRMSVHLTPVKDDDDEWNCVVKGNQAILELNHHGAGPVHVNLVTGYSKNFTVKSLKPVRKIQRYTLTDALPEMPDAARIGIYVGTHVRWSDRLVKAVDAFCQAHDAIVFCDPAANYTGQFKVNPSVLFTQELKSPLQKVDLLIHMGMMSDFCGTVIPSNVWRLAEDGLVVDRYKCLSNIFEMPEAEFFERYAQQGRRNSHANWQQLKEASDAILAEIPELPLSHIWVAQQLSSKLPAQSTLHLGILSPVRSWGYFPLPASIEVWCNQGGFGIDGNMSTMIGASLMHPERLYFAAVGDLSFFYDMNILGNRHIGNNVRILLINNGLGAEFHLFKQLNLTYVNNIQAYLSAGGHFGNKSPYAVKHLAEDWGFEYMSATSKEEFNAHYERFVTPDAQEKPLVFEVFTCVEDEDKALYDLWHIRRDNSLKKQLKQGIKELLGEDLVKKIKSELKK